MSERWKDEGWARTDEFWYSGKVTRRRFIGMGVAAGEPSALGSAEVASALVPEVPGGPAGVLGAVVPGPATLVPGRAGVVAGEPHAATITATVASAARNRLAWL